MRLVTSGCTSVAATDLMGRYPAQAYAAAHKLACSWTPLTFVVPVGAGGARQLARLRRAVQRLAASEGEYLFYKSLKLTSLAQSSILPEQHVCACAGRVWITKPGGRNRGRGIEVFDSMRDIERHLASQPCAVPAPPAGKHAASRLTQIFLHLDASNAP